MLDWTEGGRGLDMEKWRERERERGRWRGIYLMRTAAAVVVGVGQVHAKGPGSSTASSPPPPLPLAPGSRLLLLMVLLLMEAAGRGDPRSAPLPSRRAHTHRHKWSEDACSLSSDSPALEPVTCPAASSRPPPLCPLVWFTGPLQLGGGERRERKERSSGAQSPRVRGELRAGMTALTAGRSVSALPGLLLLAHCTLSVLSRGKTCSRACTDTFSIPAFWTVFLETSHSCAITPRGYASLVAFLSQHLGSLRRFANVQLCVYLISNVFGPLLIHPGTCVDCWSSSLSPPDAQQSSWYWFIKPQLSLPSSRTVYLFSVSPSNQC